MSIQLALRFDEAPITCGTSSRRPATLSHETRNPAHVSQHLENLSRACRFVL